MPTEERQNRPKAGVHLHLNNMNETNIGELKSVQLNIIHGAVLICILWSTILFSFLLRDLSRFYNRLNI